MRLLIPLLAAVLLLPAVAVADGGARALIADCQDEKVDGSYSAQEYSQALRRLPTDVDEYTSCRDTLRAAQLRAAASPRSAPAASASTGASLGRTGSSAQLEPGSTTRLEERAASTVVAADAAPAAAAVGAPAGPPPAALPRVPGLPGSALPIGADPPGPVVQVAATASGGDEVPPALAAVLVVLAAGLVTAAGSARHQRET